MLSNGWLIQEYYLVALAQQRPSSDDSPTVTKSGVSAAMGKLVRRLLFHIF